MDLVLQGEVEGEVLDALVVVGLHPGGVLVGLQVLDDVREPDGEPVVPGHSDTATRRPSLGVSHTARLALCLNRSFRHCICKTN